VGSDGGSSKDKLGEDSSIRAAAERKVKLQLGQMRELPAYRAKQPAMKRLDPGTAVRAKKHHRQSAKPSQGSLPWCAAVITGQHVDPQDALATAYDLMFKDGSRTESVPYRMVVPDVFR
jgi:hypothetical protein